MVINHFNKACLSWESHTLLLYFIIVLHRFWKYGTLKHFWSTLAHSAFEYIQAYTCKSDMYPGHIFVTW